MNLEGIVSKRREFAYLFWTDARLAEDQDCELARCEPRPLGLFEKRV